MLFLLTACDQSKVQEKFDTITTSTYTNSYDQDGRLTEVLIKRQSQFLEYGVYIPGRVVEIAQRYNYLDNDAYIITETDNLSPDEISTILRSKTFEKYYTFKNNDTIKFRMCTYMDATKSKPLMEREKYKYSGFPISDYEENVNTQTHYYYDEKNNLTKIVRTDFNSGEIIETYRFKDLQYDQAIKAVPKSKNHQDIICYSEETNADTTITFYRMNMDSPYSVKRYIDNDKTIEITFDETQKPQNKITNYTADGFDIEVIESVENGTITVDSVYRKKGKEVRSVSISPEDKSITTSKYDEKGNIVMEICKSKTNITISEEEFKEMVQRYKEYKKEEN